jgi:hypothetical protein
MMKDPNHTRCPFCGSTSFNSLESSVTDDELLECESCLRAYEVKRGPDGTERLVAV